jgi:hypothetical protein
MGGGGSRIKELEAELADERTDWLNSDANPDWDNLRAFIYIYIYIQLFGVLGAFCLPGHALI